MARDETPPFARGSTFLNGATVDSIDYGSILPGFNLEGKEYLSEDTVNLTGMYVRLRVTRNVSGITLSPNRLVTYQTGYYGRRVDGYTTTTNQFGYPVDDAYKPAYAIANNDLFYVVVEGPCQVLTSTTGGALNVINEKDLLTSVTAAASTGATTTDAGRIATSTFGTTGSTEALDEFAVSAKAMASATTANTNVLLLTYVRKTF